MGTTKEVVTTPNAPPVGGPYSQGIKAGNLLFVAGTGPFDPKTGKIVGSDIQSQTRRTLENVKAIIEASGLTLRDVVKVSVFLRNASDFEKMNDVYKTLFSENQPTRTTVEVRLVEPATLVEVDAIAYHE